MNSASFLFRTLLLALFTLSLVAGAIVTDYYLRHEETRQAKRYLAERGMDPSVRSAVQAAGEGDLEVLLNLETAGVALGAADHAGVSPLLAAVREGRGKAVDFLLDRPAGVESINLRTVAERDSPLAAALRARDFDLAERLLARGADIDAEGELGVPLLMGAVEGGDSELADFLLERGADLELRGARMVAPLAVAAAAGDLEMMGRLLRGGADPDARGAAGRPLLIEAVLDGERERFDLLLEHGADVDVRAPTASGVELSALSHAVAVRRLDMRDTLLERGADADVPGAGGAPLVLEAAEAGDFEMVERLLLAGATPDVEIHGNGTPLKAAVRNEDLELVDLLLAHGADPSLSTNGSPAPLLEAAGRGNVAIAYQLIAAGAELDSPTLLAAAYERRDDPLMHLFLSAGVDPESAFPGGGERIFDVAVREGATGAVRTLLAGGAEIGDNLWAALLTGQYDLIRLILSAGGDPRQKGPDGQDPLDYCLRNGRYQAARWLLEGGADPDAMYDEEESWLSRAVREGDAETALALIEAGAAVEGAKASDGHSLLGWAIAHNLNDVSLALLKAGADPNAEERAPATPEFRDMFEGRTFRYHLQVDRRIRPLMMAAAQRNHEVAEALMAAGAQGNAYTPRYLMAVNIGAWYSDVRMMQTVLLGKAPEVQRRKVVIDLGSQRATLYVDGKAVYSSTVSTGRPGHRTPRGEYVITSKHRHHVSNIYHSSMPFFMRFSCSAFGMHQGHLPGYPASAGCIRLPYAGARYFWDNVRIGDYAVIR